MRSVHGFVLASALSVLAATSAGAQPAAVQQFDGTLDASDPRDTNGRPYEEHRATLEGGQTYRIAVNSTRFDTIVQVLGPGGDVVAYDDDGGIGVNARATYTPTQSGEYVVRALGFLPDSAGSYFMRIERAVPFPPPLRAELRPGTADTTVWTSYSGSLGDDDPSLDGVRFDDYLVTLAAGEELFIRVDSEAFDPLVRVLPADRREGDSIAADDDSGPGRNALLLFTPAEAGDYVVRVTAFGTTRTRSFVGDYRLRFGR